jgi:CRP/FNR family transcriptional regulator, cyclic AMP receptor protein
VISTIERVLFLKSVPLFAGIGGESLVGVAEIAVEEHFHEAAEVIRQGDPGTSLHVIVSGEARVLVEGVQVATLLAGNVIGEMGVLAGVPRTATCVAASELTTLRIDREDFYDLMGERPDVALGVVRILVHRLNEANERLQAAGPA